VYTNTIREKKSRGEKGKKRGLEIEGQYMKKEAIK